MIKCSRHQFATTVVLFVFVAPGHSWAQTFIEDFADTAQRDDTRTFADWGGDTGVLRLPGGVARSGTFSTTTPRVDVGVDVRHSYTAVLADADGDGDLDALTGFQQAPGAVFYPNNGTSDPYTGITGTVFGRHTQALTAGDYNNDGDIDLVSGGFGSFSSATTYIPNNGTASPFAGGGISVISQTVSMGSFDSADIDGDGNLDFVAFGQQGLFYRNTGNDAASGQFTLLFERLEVGSGSGAIAVAIADMDWDGLIDVISSGGSSSPEQLFLNNGTADPFGGVTASDIGADALTTRSVATGDMNGDGGVDVMAGHVAGQAVRMHLNNLTADPFSGVTGSDVGTETDFTYSVAVGDLDGDGDLDAVVGNSSITCSVCYYLNNGTDDPFAGVVRTTISNDAQTVKQINLGDVDQDGDLDILAARGQFGSEQLDVVYFNAGTQVEGAGSGPPFDTSRGQAVSQEMDNLDDNIARATLTVSATTPPNTGIEYYMSNNGGGKFSQVRPGVPFCFTTTGSDLRWKAVLSSLSPVVTPEIDTLSIAVDPDADCDGIDDAVDNCVLVANPDQRDTDGDLIGNNCDADVSQPNNDCIVNFLDLLQYRANFFQMGDFDTDNNGDNITNFIDLLVVRQQFFGPPGPSASGCN